MHYLAIALGGALGAMARAYVSNLAIKILGTSFPFATLTVNLLGSLLMGFVAVLIFDYLKLSGYWREVIMVGFLGAFTTFSTFSMEGLNLINSGQWQTALVYFVVSVVGSVSACFVGWYVAKLIF
ncbi:fluoride efflux transporter CrcB [Bermanella marisrubri]|uniref:Fluoride-specific ion channel FluC n=1 Tax=Bermanella marisrubri TaxID=207949 RepID=Q1N4M3_9GAMM|nr:fluoride efflux transporter CrcB [Bermanella marisrubri]EAT13405.1 camphor resistance protein CrcB [Oceanobacter sp. RED65] [Bermanella marisrubri]QIZ84155.1 fluoride efflux transporter CrcB [Bermanella marisrubri]